MMKYPAWAFERPNTVLKAIAPVVEGSMYVRIDRDRIRQFSSHFMESDIRHWMTSSPVDLSGLSDDQKLAFLFVFNSISFSYWGNPKWLVPLEGNDHPRGTFCMLASLRKAVADGRPILNPEYLATIRREEVAEILRGTTEIPMLSERCAILRELGEGTIKWRGKFANFIEAARSDALDLVLIVRSAFPSFTDASFIGDNYKLQVDFYKRAQLLVSDIHTVFRGNGYGNLSRVEELTACADYILPMVLRHFGILVYNQTLAEQVDGGIQIPKDDQKEIEIRANTIFAVELLREELRERFPGITSMDLNDYLWLARTEILEHVKHHLTRTTAY